MTLLNPAGLLFAIFLVGLFLLYLWERNQRRVDVPSMLLWEVVPESVVRRNRFQPDSLFWLQFAGLACLVFGLAGPYFEDTDRTHLPHRAILILDLSASMQTIEDGVSRLDLARDAASRVILSSPPETELMLIGAPREPRVVAPFTHEQQDLLALLSALEASDVSASLDPALAMAQRLAFPSVVPTEVHVFTDLPRASVAERWRDAINWWPVGSSDDNLAIANVETTQGVLQDHHHAAARVTVRNFSARDKHGSLTVSVGGRPIGKELFTSSPHDISVFHFPDLPVSGLLEATLESDDALAVDNHWRAWVPHFRPIRIALVGAPPELRRSIVRLGTATNAVEVVSAGEPVAFSGPTDIRKNADVAIYYRVTPEQLPDIPALLIAPPTDLSSQRPQEEVGGLQVLDWNENHPVLRGIAPHLLRTFETGVALAPPPWSETILHARSGGRDLPILVVGQPTRHRMAILTPLIDGDDLLRSDRETTLLLFINLLDWLVGQKTEVPVLRTGESRPLADASLDAIEVIDPRGRPVAVPSGPKPFLSFDLAGVYRVNRPGEPPSHILANFQDAAESSIARDPEAPHRVTSDALSTRAERSGSGPQRWLFFVAAALLITEWLAATRAHDHG